MLQHTIHAYKASTPCFAFRVSGSHKHNQIRVDSFNQYNADYWLSGRMVKLAWWQSAWTWNHLDIL